MDNEVINLLNKLLQQTVLLVREIKKLNSRLKYKLTKEMIKKNKINNNIFHYTNSSSNPDKRNYEDIEFINGNVIVSFD